MSLPAAAAMATAVLRRMNHDPAFRSEVDSAVMRVLVAKQAYGLLPCPAGVDPATAARHAVQLCRKAASLAATSARNIG